MMNRWFKRLMLFGMLLSIPPVCVGLQHSFSIGGSVGAAFYHDTFTTDLFNLNNPLATRRDVLAEVNESGVFWGFLIGYQVGFLGWFIGAEFDVDWVDLDEPETPRFSDARQVNTWQGAFQFDKEPVMTLVARLGYKIAPYFVPYMRAGVETSQDKLRATYTSARLNLSPSSLTLDGSARSYRYIVGLGAEFPLPLKTCPALRLEYNYHAKGKTVEVRGTLRDNAGIFPNFDSTANPKTNSGKLSIVWNI